MLGSTKEDAPNLVGDLIADCRQRLVHTNAQYQATTGETGGGGYLPRQAGKGPISDSIEGAAYVKQLYFISADLSQARYSISTRGDKLTEGKSRAGPPFPSLAPSAWVRVRARQGRNARRGEKRDKSHDGAARSARARRWQSCDWLVASRCSGLGPARLRLFWTSGGREPPAGDTGPAGFSGLSPVITGTLEIPGASLGPLRLTQTSRPVVVPSSIEPLTKDGRKAVRDGGARHRPGLALLYHLDGRG